MTNFNSFDVLAVKNALPYLYLTESQARTILIAIYDQIASRAREQYHKDFMTIVSALVNEQGGEFRISKSVLEAQNPNELSRFDDPITGDIIFSTSVEVPAKEET